ncbi:MAG: hypothetical protein SFU99_17170 [Saprospiraceae bacterium]|nr:hypothetical protein [Saprospiraceae bacterium]
MRIIGYIEHPILKITVFKMGNKISIKFESGLYEQTYKLRSGEAVSTLADVEKIVDDTFCNEVLHILNQMHSIKNQAMIRALPTAPQEEFEEII